MIGFNNVNSWNSQQFNQVNYNSPGNQQFAGVFQLLGLLLLTGLGGRQPALGNDFQPAINQNVTYGGNNSGFNTTSIWNNLFSGGVPGNFNQTEISVIPKDTGLDAMSWGDPHFDLNGKRAFDFIGKHNSEYKILDNSDVSINARFVDGKSEDAKNLEIAGTDIKTVIGDENITFKGTGINIVARNDKSFDVYKHGKKIADESNYKDVADELEAAGIKINNSEKNKTNYEFINIEYKGRTISVGGTHGGIMNNVDLKEGDRGLQAQTAGALDQDDKKNDGKTTGVFDINKDGKIDDKDVLNYNLNEQVFKHTNYERKYDFEVNLTDEAKAAIRRDIREGNGPLVSRFTGKGYSEAQWNEYLGHNLFSTNDRFLG